MSALSVAEPHRRCQPNPQAQDSAAPGRNPAPSAPVVRGAARFAGSRGTRKPSKRCRPVREAPILPHPGGPRRPDGNVGHGSAAPCGARPTQAIRSETVPAAATATARTFRFAPFGPNQPKIGREMEIVKKFKNLKKFPLFVDETLDTPGRGGYPCKGRSGEGSERRLSLDVRNTRGNPRWRSRP